MKSSKNASSPVRRNGRAKPTLESLPLSIRRDPTSDPAAWRAAGGKPTCQGCVAHCCRYISVEIDRPEAKWQYDQIFWMLLHEDVAAYVEKDGEWYIEFRTRCTALNEANLCEIYPDRPNLCREYSNETCPVWSEETPYKHRWETAQEFAAWLDAKGRNWRYKDRGGYAPTRITKKRPVPGGAELPERERPPRRAPARSGAGGRAPGRSPRK